MESINKYDRVGLIGTLGLIAFVVFWVCLCWGTWKCLGVTFDDEDDDDEYGPSLRRRRSIREREVPGEPPTEICHLIHNHPTYHRDLAEDEIGCIETFV